MHSRLKKLKRGTIFGSGLSECEVMSITDEAIIYVLRRTGSLRMLPTDLISRVIGAIEDGEISNEDIMSRRKNGRHIVEFLGVRHDKFVFGYQGNIRDICNFCLERV